MKTRAPEESAPTQVAIVKEAYKLRSWIGWYQENNNRDKYNMSVVNFSLAAMINGFQLWSPKLFITFFFIISYISKDYAKARWTT